LTTIHNFFSNSDCGGNKKTSYKVGGEQFEWSKETFVPSASANAEKLLIEEEDLE
jgi:hypothetical protein